MRRAAGFAVLALAAWLLLAVLGPREAPASAMQFTSSQQCRECHAEVYAEWEQSWHALSWVDEDVRVQSKDFADTNCIDCHAPRPVFETGIGQRVLPRTSRRSEGVDCITCHVLPDGGVAGTIENKSAACRPVGTVELQRVEFCAGCHDQHKTVRQWRETPYAESGTGCLECHMPFRDGDPNRGRSHLMAGGHDIDLLRSAVELRGRRDGDSWRVEVENVAAGHSFPTDERSRAADVFWRPVSEGRDVGTGPWRFVHRIRDPYRFEVGVPSTLIQHGETREIVFRDADATGPIEVGLFYKLTPYYRDPDTGDPMRTEDVTDPLIDSVLVHRIVIEP